MSRLPTPGFTWCPLWLATRSEASFLVLSSSGNTPHNHDSCDRLTHSRTASYKLLTLLGTLSSFTCYLLLILRWRGNTSIWESLYIFPGGFGTGIVQATTFVALAAGVDEAQMAIASTGLYLSASIGGLVGASLASKVLEASLANGLKVRLKGFEDRQLVGLFLPSLSPSLLLAWI